MKPFTYEINNLPLHYSLLIEIIFYLIKINSIEAELINLCEDLLLLNQHLQKDFIDQTLIFY